MNSRHFIKHNPLPGSNSLLCEANGLNAIASGYPEKHGLLTPKIIILEQERLVLEQLPLIEANDEQYRFLGQQLARMHKMNGQAFGLDHNNYIGLSPQANIWSQDWGEFFYSYRLLAQVEMMKRPQMQDQWQKKLALKQKEITDLLNQDRPIPSLVHGDLWKGNILFSKDKVYLIDPAYYYGDREVDLAMTEFFGGFPQTFYQAYNENWQLPKNYPRRKNLYNLYHAFNHYNLFGPSYVNVMEKLWRQFTENNF